MKIIAIALIMLGSWASVLAYAEDANTNTPAEDVPGSPKVKGVDVVPDTAVAVLKKVNAFFTGDLTWTMPSGKDVYKDDYVVNPLGQKTPRATLKKYDSGVR